MAPKRKGKRRQKVVYGGSESESEAGEDPAGERRSSRQRKLEDQKSNEKQEQNNAPTCAGDSGRRTLQGREFGNLCDVFTVRRCSQHFSRTHRGLWLVALGWLVCILAFSGMPQLNPVKMQENNHFSMYFEV